MKPEERKLQISQLLLENPDQEYESYQIAKLLFTSKSTINEYLVVMESDALVSRRCVGYYVYWKAHPLKALARKLVSRLWNIDILK